MKCIFEFYFFENMVEIKTIIMIIIVVIMFIAIAYCAMRCRNKCCKEQENEEKQNGGDYSDDYDYSNDYDYSDDDDDSYTPSSYKKKKYTDNEIKNMLNKVKGGYKFYNSGSLSQSL